MATDTTLLKLVELMQKQMEGAKIEDAKWEERFQKQIKEADIVNAERKELLLKLIEKQKKERILESR
jgi:hypothetical protein